MKTRYLRLFGIYGLLFAAVLPSQGQWLTQTNTLKPGWNAVFLHVDASHLTVDQVIASDPASPIHEIWQWQAPGSSGQYVESPQMPTGQGTPWLSWARAIGPGSALRRLSGNAAYLVRVTNSVGYTWRVTGKPVAPGYKWTLTGLNFIGFPTVPQTPPTFEAFLDPAPDLKVNGEIYGYRGGELGATNPARIFAFRTTPVNRDQAYWVRAGDLYNQYFGPYQLQEVEVAGIRFGRSQGQAQFRLRNLAASTVTVRLSAVNSEASPSGQPAILGFPPLMVRGEINKTNLTFSYTTLATTPKQWVLAPAGEVGSEVEVVLGLNRYAMNGTPGALHAGVLRFTDSLNLSQVDVPVSAEVGTRAGLWVGGASVSQVHHYLKPFARATNAVEFTNLLARLQLGQGTNGYRYEWDASTGRVLVFGGPENKTGSYLLDGPVKIDSGAVAKPMPLRLIVHNDGATARLLQRVYYGFGVASNEVLATKESLLSPNLLSSARRISAVHLPVTAANTPWNFTGAMQRGSSISATIATAYDDQASSPFLHTYHPDHDNLDALFSTPLARGAESYDISRQITLNFTAPAGDFDSLTRGSQDLSGTYAETVTLRSTGSQSRQYNVLGTFVLQRINEIATLTTQ